MSDTIEVDGTEYKLEGNPSLGTVREVQSMQMNVIKEYVSDEELKEMDSLDDEGEIIEVILDSGGLSALQDVMWEKSMLETTQTISLAADYAFEPSSFDDMRANEFKDVREKAHDALGGSATDFFKGLGIGLSLTSDEMERRATKAAGKREI